MPEKGHYQSSKRVKEAINRVLGKPNEPSKAAEEVKAKTKRKARQTNSEEPAPKVEKTIVQPPKDWKREDELKQQQAKQKALAVMKRVPKVERKKTNKKYQVSRKILRKHNLSESESD